MLTRARLRREEGSALITALMVILIMLPIGMALLAIVDTQARNSDSERTRDRAFNLADSALTSAAFSLGRYSWPSTAAAAPSNTGATGSVAQCRNASFGATLGGATSTGSATSKLQPNLNASYDDAAYTGATWQINVCDDAGSAVAGSTVWNDGLLLNSNYDANNNQLVWVRSEARVGNHRRVLAALVRVEQTPALSSKFGLMTGRMNSEISNTLGTVLSGPALDSVTSALLGVDPLVAPDLAHNTTPPTSGVTGVRCGALDGCLTGTLGSLGSLAAFDTLVTGGKLVQATTKSATTAAAIEQLKQQAINAGTYVASTPGTASPTSPPACPIPAGANANTIVYIEKIGTTGPPTGVGRRGDQYCVLDVSGDVAFKALVIGAGRVVLRGNNTAAGGTFRGLVYGLNDQREWLGDAATPTREIVRLDRGAHVIGGVAADGKSAQVGIYPPTIAIEDCGILTILCDLLDVVNQTLGFLNNYNPAIRSNVNLMDQVKIYDSATVVPGTYRDIAGEAR